MPPFGFRLRVLVLRGRLPTTDEPIVVPYIERTTTLIIEPGTGRRPDRLILRQTGFDSEQQARVAGQAAKAALRAAGVEADVPMDLGPDQASTGIGQIVKDRIKEKFGAEARGDVHGVDVFDEAGPDITYMHMDAEGRATVNRDEFVDTLGRSLTKAPSADSDERVQLASEVFMAAAFESSDRARFVTYITVLETLATRESRGRHALDLIEDTIRQLDSREDLDPTAKKSLRSGLLDLQKESIGTSIRSLVESIDTSEVELGGRSIRRFISDCYTARSGLVHDGHPGDGFDLRAEVPRLARVAREALLSRLNSE